MTSFRQDAVFPATVVTLAPPAGATEREHVGLEVEGFAISCKLTEGQLGILFDECRKDVYSEHLRQAYGLA